MNAAQLLEQRGYEKGKAEGKAEGEARLLERLLERKYGGLPESIRERLSGATSEQLETWSERVLFADSIEAVFAEK